MIPLIYSFILLSFWSWELCKEISNLLWLYIRSCFMICFRHKMIDVARIYTYTCLRRPTDNMMNKSNCSRTKSTHIQYIERQCRIRITNTIMLYESVLGCRRCSFDNAIFSLIIMLVSWFLCLSISLFL